MSTERRINAELKEITNSQTDLYTGKPIGTNIYKWRASIKGPKDSPYQNGRFHLFVEFPLNYPFKPPKISFITKIYHCNIDNEGGICLDILKESWSPALTISKVLLSIISLLDDPNPNDPLMLDIAKLYNNNREEHNRIAKEITNKYAIDIVEC